MEVLDSKTILVSPRNPAKRRTYARTFVKTIHLANVTTPQGITEIITALRTLLNMRYIAQVPATHAIAIHDTPSQLALAEKIVADLDRPAGNQAAGPTPAVPLDAGSEVGGVLRSRALRKLVSAPSQLPPGVVTRVTVDLNEDTRTSYERLAQMAGLQVTFESRFQNGPVQRLKLRDVDVADALDFLGLQSGTFWQILDDSTIMVAPDNPAARRDLEPRIAKTIHLSRIRTPAGILEVVTALRTLFNAVQLEASANAVVMRDTAENLALAEKFIADLDRP